LFFGCPYFFKYTEVVKMIGSPMSFLLYGIALVVVFAGIIFYNYSKKRKDYVEEAKYRMLDDDDD
jgi:cbb3-type cytochrome oxidase subunit 3